MRIAFLNPSGSLGGAERVLLDLLTGLRARRPGWRLRLIVAGDGPLMTASAALGVEVEALPFPASVARLGDAGADGPAGRQLGRFGLLAAVARSAPAAARYTRRLRRRLAGFGADLIHTNGFKMHLLGLWARPVPTPVIWHIHDYVSARPLMARLLRWHAGRPAAAVANSASVAKDLAAVCGGATPISAVLNGVDLERFAPGGLLLDLDHLAGAPPPAPGSVKVGLLATFGRWKGQRTFLQALAYLPPELAVHGYVIGGPVYETEGSQHHEQELRRHAAELGVSDRVTFTGFVDEAAAALRALDVVVHASTRPEPFGLVIAEAMACARAVVISDAGGARELIEEEVDALAHPPGDAARLSRQIARLAADPELRRRLGEAARRSAEERFDRRRLAAGFLPIYEKIAAGA